MLGSQVVAVEEAVEVDVGKAVTGQCTPGEEGRRGRRQGRYL